jgi:NAD-dependent SIR2 family protein deacetylase
MTREPDLMETPDLPDELKQAALNGEFVLFVGAGVSKLVGLPSWRALAELVLNDLQQAGKLNFSEMDQLRTLDPKTQLSIAKQIASQNSLTLDLGKHLKSPKEEGIYRYLNKVGCACVTTNYDELLSPRFTPPGGATSPTTVKRVIKTNEFYADNLDSPGTVVHLHGSLSDPSTIIATTKDYLEHYDKEEVQHFLSELFKKKVVLFIGYGLEEAEILEHILRRGKVGDEQVKRRFALQGFFLSQQPLYRNLHEYYMKSFGVHVIGFVRDHKDYRQLEAITKAWSEVIQIRPPALADGLGFIDEVIGDA